jgi:MraZ protein
MFAGEFRLRADAGGLYQLPPIVLAAFPSPEAAAGWQLICLKSLDRSLWLYDARGWEAKLEATRAQLENEQGRLLMH